MPIVQIFLTYLVLTKRPTGPHLQRHKAPPHDPTWRTQWLSCCHCHLLGSWNGDALLSHPYSQAGPQVPQKSAALSKGAKCTKIHNAAFDQFNAWRQEKERHSCPWAPDVWRQTVSENFLWLLTSSFWLLFLLRPPPLVFIFTPLTQFVSLVVGLWNNRPRVESRSPLDAKCSLVFEVRVMTFWCPDVTYREPPSNLRLTSCHPEGWKYMLESGFKLTVQTMGQS